MPILNTIKYSGHEEDVVWRFPSSELKLGSQLVVNNGQSAVFVKDGQVCDIFKPGRYTLKTANLPIIGKLFTKAYDGDSPFTAEVWFVNSVSKLDNKWGTITPIQVEDPLYKIVVPVRAFGQFGFRIEDPKLFCKEIVGTAKIFTTEEIINYFSGLIMSTTQNLIAEKIIKDKISTLAITMHMNDIAEYCSKEIDKEFSKFGIELVNFYIMSINIDPRDSSVEALKKAQSKAMHVKTVGKDVYQMEESFEVLNKAAGNAGSGGDIMSSAIGLGVGFNTGAAMGNQMGTLTNNMQTSQQPGNQTPPPLPTTGVASPLFFLELDNKQSGPFSVTDINQMKQDGKINSQTLSWKQGTNDWIPCEQQSDLQKSFASSPPPLPKKEPIETKKEGKK